MMILERFRVVPPLSWLNTSSASNDARPFQVTGPVGSRMMRLINCVRRIIHGWRAAFGMRSISRVHGAWDCWSFSMVPESIASVVSVECRPSLCHAWAVCGNCPVMISFWLEPAPCWIDEMTDGLSNPGQGLSRGPCLCNSSVERWILKTDQQIEQDPRLLGHLLAYLQPATIESLTQMANHRQPTMRVWQYR